MVAASSNYFTFFAGRRGCLHCGLSGDSLCVILIRVRVYTSINTGNRAVTTLPLDKVNNHFSDRIIINYDF